MSKPQHESFRRFSPQEILVAMQIGVQAQQQGNLQRAEAIYRHVLAQEPRHADALHLLGLIALQANRPEEAEKLIRLALKTAPHTALFHENLGRVLLVQGKRQEAIHAYRAALKYNSRSGSIYNDLSVVLLEVGETKEAEKMARRAIALTQTHAAAHYNLGNILTATGRCQEAVPSYQQAIRLQPDYAEAHNNLGNVYGTLGQLEEAMQSYRAALAIRPAYADAHNNLGNVLTAAGEWEQAVVCFHEALRLHPNYAETHNNLGNALREQGAAESIEQSLRLRPMDAEAHSNLAVVLAALGRNEEAHSQYNTAFRLQPESAAAHNNLGKLLNDQNRLIESEGHYQQALKANPNLAQTHMNLALIHLVKGDLPRGFAEYEWRWKIGNAALPNWPQPRWEGQPLQGRTILLYEEQGFGDTLQFIRYADLIKAQKGSAGGSVLVRCNPTFQRLFARSASIDAVILPESELPAFDCHAPLMSLPLLMATSLETVPQAVPYLSAEPQLINHWRSRLPPNAIKVGICWQGNSKHLRDRQRSFPLSCFAPLADDNDVQFICLQKGTGNAQLQEAEAKLRERITVIEELNEAEWDFMDTAAVMMNLDLVITADTSVAHLAGALGIPVWVALPFSPDWRWLLDREDSPWYPTLRLFRQRQPGDWADVFTRLKMALEQEWVNARNKLSAGE